MESIVYMQEQKDPQPKIITIKKPQSNPTVNDTDFPAQKMSAHIKPNQKSGNSKRAELLRAKIDTVFLSSTLLQSTHY